MAATIKIILLIIMWFAAFVSGTIPLWVSGWLIRPERLSLLSCFAGGVFMAVCFLDMFPDAIEIMKKIEIETKTELRYPYFELFVCAGFFIVVLIEDALAIKAANDAARAGQLQENGEVIDDNADDPSVNLIHAANASTLKVAKKSRPLTLVSALAIHSILEGFAFGLQKTLADAVTLFVGITVHKVVVFFSTGTRLVMANPSKWRLTTLAILFLSLCSPIGAVIGIALQDMEMNELTKNIIMAIAISISLGTFLYITFFEILAEERQANVEQHFRQWLAAVIGFGIIAVVIIFSP